MKELKAARAAAEATAIKGKPLELVIADESGNPRKASTVSAASMSTQSMMRGILNPRNPTEAELGMWWMFLRDVVRSSMGIVSAEIWQDVDDSAGVVLKRIAYYTDPNYEAFDASEELLNGDPGECVPGVGMAGVLWDMMAQKGAPVEWRLLSGIAADEDIPDDPRIDAAAKAFGHVGAQYLEGRQPYASMWSANEAEHDNGAMLLSSRAAAPPATRRRSCSTCSTTRRTSPISARRRRSAARWWRRRRAAPPSTRRR